MPKIVEKNKDKSNMVRSLSGLGITQDQICAILDISRNTLTKYYEDELKVGKAQANSKVAENLFRIATGSTHGSVTAAIFWLKCQAGWKDTNTIEVINADSHEKQFNKLIENIRDAKLNREESDDTTH
jgi:DNA-binding XRE family transcriptional regulator